MAVIPWAFVPTSVVDNETNCITDSSAVEVTSLRVCLLLYRRTILGGVYCSTTDTISH